jgi:hypothetical protein
VSTLAQLAAELKSWFPEADPLACPTLVRRALKDIYDSRDWSFNKGNGSWFAPNQITSGTVTTTQFSNLVVADGTATPYWQAIALPTLPQSPITLRQFRVNGGPIYNIVAYDGASTITLDRPYAETGAAGASYMVYQPYMPAPTIDFKRWMSIVDPVSGYRFRYQNMFRTQKELDKVDPQRTSFGWPTWVVGKDYVTLPGDTQQRPRFELGLGHPIQAVGYILEFQRSGEDAITPTAVIPRQISDSTIMARARFYGHDLVSNQPNVDVKVKAFHMQKQRMVKAQYVDLLRGDKARDNSVWDSLVIDERHGADLNGPVDSDYIMSHVLSWVE